ncbi:uncharacterized protein LJ206_008117 isoform 1-T1 [Theristicus caerulescens]
MMDIPGRAEGYRYYFGSEHPAESTDHQPLLSITAETSPKSLAASHRTCLPVLPPALLPSSESIQGPEHPSSIVGPRTAHRIQEIPGTSLSQALPEMPPAKCGVVEIIGTAQDFSRPLCHRQEN